MAGVLVEVNVENCGLQNWLKPPLLVVAAQVLPLNNICTITFTVSQHI